MIGRMCKVGDGLSRPVLIARETFSRERYAELKCKLKSERSLSSSGPEGRLEVFFSQVIYCGGYSGEEPPLPIPNREVKLTIADGTATPGGRVGSCRSSTSRLEKSSRDDRYNKNPQGKSSLGDSKNRSYLLSHLVGQYHRRW